MSYLMPLALRRDQLKVQAGIELNEKLAEEIKELDALYSKLDKSIPIWPFNFKSVETFFIAIISPLLPAILPVITDILKSTFVN